MVAKDAFFQFRSLAPFGAGAAVFSVALGARNGTAQGSWHSVFADVQCLAASSALLRAAIASRTAALASSMQTMA